MTNSIITEKTLDEIKPCTITSTKGYCQLLLLLLLSHAFTSLALGGTHKKAIGL